MTTKIAHPLGLVLFLMAALSAGGCMAPLADTRREVVSETGIEGEWQLEFTELESGRATVHVAAVLGEVGGLRIELVPEAAAEGPHAETVVLEGQLLKSGPHEYLTFQPGITKTLALTPFFLPVQHTLRLDRDGDDGLRLLMVENALIWTPAEFAGKFTFDPAPVADAQLRLAPTLDDVLDAYDKTLSTEWSPVATLTRVR